MAKQKVKEHKHVGATAPVPYAPEPDLDKLQHAIDAADATVETYAGNLNFFLRKDGKRDHAAIAAAAEAVGAGAIRLKNSLADLASAKKAAAISEANKEE